MKNLDKIASIKKNSFFLDELVETIKSHIIKKRKERESWLEWHQEWKKAWLPDPSQTYSEEELLKKRQETTVTKRMPVYK